MSDWVDVDPDEAYVFVEPPAPPKKANALPETTFMSPVLGKAFKRLANNKCDQVRLLSSLKGN